jgi:hypothetical protein
MKTLTGQFPVGLMSRVFDAGKSGYLFVGRLYSRGLSQQYRRLPNTASPPIIHALRKGSAVIRAEFQ